MGREQMRNLEVFKTPRGPVNEFEYQKHHGEMTEQEHADKQGGGTGQPSRAERVKQVMEAARKKVEKRRKKGLVAAPTTKKISSKTTKKPAAKSGKKSSTKSAKKR